jgi:hypothetical protein
MTTYGRNAKDLEKYLKNLAKQVCDYASNVVYEAINYYLNQYYLEFDPVSYRRTEQLLRSAFKTKSVWSGSAWTAEVGIDYESLDYNEATGYDVISYANQGLHGGIDVGSDTHVYDDAINKTIRNGQLIEDIIKYIQDKGIRVTR